MWFVIEAGQTCILIGQNTSVGNSVNCIARRDLHCDWSFQIPVVNIHMTLTELQSDWNAQIHFPGPIEDCVHIATPDPFFLSEGGIWGRD